MLPYLCIVKEILTAGLFVLQSDYEVALNCKKDININKICRISFDFSNRQWTLKLTNYRTYCVCRLFGTRQPETTIMLFSEATPHLSGSNLSDLKQANIPVLSGINQAQTMQFDFTIVKSERVYKFWHMPPVLRISLKILDF